MTYQVRYTALRFLNLTPSPVHTVGNTYTLALTPTEVDHSRAVMGSDQKALTGKIYTTYLNGLSVWKIRLRPETVIDDLREFIYSIESGGRFEIDLNDGVGFRFVKRHGKIPKEKRAIRQGSGGTDYFVFTFSVIEVP